MRYLPLGSLVDVGLNHIEMLHVILGTEHEDRHYTGTMEFDECTIFFTTSRKYKSIRVLNDDDAFNIDYYINEILCSDEVMTSGDYRDLLIVLGCLRNIISAYLYGYEDDVPRLMKRLRRHARVSFVDENPEEYRHLISTHQHDMENMFL